MRPAVTSHVFSLPIAEREGLIGKLHATASLYELKEFFEKLVCRFCQRECNVEIAFQSNIGTISCTTCHHDLGEGEVTPSSLQREPPGWMGPRGGVEHSEFERRFQKAVNKRWEK